MLAPILDGNDRFYVMALNDINEDFYYWYYSARKTKDLILLQKDFGHGKENTVTLFNKWCDEKYGKQDHEDRNEYRGRYAVRPRLCQRLHGHRYRQDGSGSRQPLHPDHR